MKTGSPKMRNKKSTGMKKRGTQHQKKESKPLTGTSSMVQTLPAIVAKDVSLRIALRC